ncbi:MAG: thioesterase [Rhodoglobus sp.]|nr:thioesterase [Rhodoglobus sp.]
MHLIFRTLIHMIRSRRKPSLGIHDVGRMTLRVVATDLDVLGHMNNGVYFSLMDLGRMDLMIRAGLWKKFIQKGYYPVMANETATFRKSLTHGTKFVLETRIVGYDDRAVYGEQRFVVNGEIYMSAMTRARFLKKSGGTVSLAELAELTGVDTSALTPPAWVAEWAKNVQLPTTREAAPSEWA